MSQYGLIYRLEWDTTDVVRSLQLINVTAKTIRVNIYDTTVLIGDAETPTVIPLQCADRPLTLSVVNNDEDKFSPVRAKQALIRFLTDRSAGKDITLFLDGTDNQFYVEIIGDGLTVFLGYIMMSDVEQPFQPDPQTVELTVTDHLGILKEIPYTHDDGSAPFGKYKLGVVLATALKKTGLSLPIFAVNNVKHGSGAITIPAGFITDGDLIFVENAYYNFFYPGQKLQVTTTAGNNITLTVFSVTGSFFTIISVYENLTDETAAGATFTDLSSGHIYDKIYIDVFTFEENIAQYEDSRTVLEKILGEDCYLTQWKGAWWIMRVAEINAGVMYPAEFDEDGLLVDYTDPISPSRNIGDQASICVEGASISLRANRKHKFVKEIYRYITPKEIFCNIDLSRGDVITPPNLALSDTTGTYVAQCWTMRRIAGSITSTAYIVRRFEYGYEKDKYMLITPKTGLATPWDFMESSPVEVRTKDKANVTISWRYENDFGGGGSTVYPLRIYLKADDGTWWYWWHPSSSNRDDFYWTNGGTTEKERLIPTFFDAAETDLTVWQTIGVDLDPMPADGKLYIGLNQGQQVASGGTNQNIYYQGIGLDLQPFINGGYGQYSGHYNKVTRTGGGAGYNAKREKEVSLGDSPRKNFKGAMFFLSGGIYFLTTKFFEAHLYAMGNPVLSEINTFGYLQAFAVWNQYRQANRIFPTSLYGIFSQASPDQWPDIMNKFAITDADENTDNRVFMLVSFSQDWKRCKWTATLIECYNSAVGQDRTDDHEFKYIL